MLAHRVRQSRRALCIRPWSDTIAHKSTRPSNNYAPWTGPRPDASKSVTQMFDEAIQSARTTSAPKAKPKPPRPPKSVEKPSRRMSPMDGYEPRFSYNGYLKNRTWISYDEHPQATKTPEYMALQRDYAQRPKSMHCLLMAFAGDNYRGMQYNKDSDTIERRLFEAMVRHRCMLAEHVDRLNGVRFVHGSRTDRGVSAMRMACSMILPNDVNVAALNADLPADIRLLCVRRAARQFDARKFCSARTYSYTLPTIAFSHYTDQTAPERFRVSPAQLQRAHDILAGFKGATNFHNYSPGKLFYDRSSTRTMYAIDIAEPFVERDVEFCRIVINGQSFMLHQIRRMVGFALAVIRGVIADDMMRRSFTDEIFNAPTAPGLGLVLERLHYPRYSDRFPHMDPLTFDEYDGEVERFRRDVIQPHIVRTEIGERSMVEWLELLGVHGFDAAARLREETRRYHNDDEHGEEWGESEQFVQKLRKMREENA